MLCPACGGSRNETIRTIPGRVTVRRHACLDCEARWTSDQAVRPGSLWRKGDPIPANGGRGYPLPVAGIDHIGPASPATGSGQIVRTGAISRPPPATGSAPPAEIVRGGIGGGLPSDQVLGLVLVSPDLIRGSKRSGRSARPKAPRAETPAFGAFYAAYPRKEKRPAAFRAWLKQGCESIADLVMAGLAKWIPEYAAREPDKVPHPSTWLNGQQWNDEPPRRGSQGGGGGSDLDRLARELAEAG